MTTQLSHPQDPAFHLSARDRILTYNACPGDRALYWPLRPLDLNLR